MTIIIDGYNVLKQFFSGYIDEKLRAAFVSDMQRYASIKSHAIVIVFDGDGDFYARYEKKRDIQVLYSGRESTADDAIKDLVDTHALRDILLVSDDRELNEYASSNAIASVGSRDFYRFVQEALQQRVKKRAHSSLIKTSSNVNPDLDDLMLSTSNRVMIKDEDALSGSAHKERNKKSKIDRLLLKKLEKL